MKLLRSAVVLLASVSAVYATRVTGKLADVTGRPYTTGTFVRLDLKNCASIPRVVGQAVIVPTSKSVYPDSQGRLQSDVIGNDVITCDILGNTYYRVTVWVGSTIILDRNYKITGSTWNVSTASPLANVPTEVLTPENGFSPGDTLYYNGTEIAVLPGTVSRRFYSMTNNIPSWGTLTVDDLPNNIPIEKISGSGTPTFSGDLLNPNSSLTVTVAGLRGRPLASTLPSGNDVMGYSNSTWTPISLSTLMTQIAANRLPFTSNPKIWVYDGASVAVADLDVNTLILENTNGVLQLRSVSSSTPSFSNFQTDYFVATQNAQTFTLSFTPVNGPRPTEVFKNNLKLRSGASYDYTITDRTLTFTVNNPVEIDDIVEVNYYR